MPAFRPFSRTSARFCAGENGKRKKQNTVVSIARERLTFRRMFCFAMREDVVKQRAVVAYTVPTVVSTVLVAVAAAVATKRLERANAIAQTKLATKKLPGMWSHRQEHGIKTTSERASKQAGAQASRPTYHPSTEQASSRNERATMKATRVTKRPSFLPSEKRRHDRDMVLLRIHILVLPYVTTVRTYSLTTKTVWDEDTVYQPRIANTLMRTTHVQ